MIKTIHPLKGSTALVTGVGRTRGIGTAICRKLAQEGVDIFFSYWRQCDTEEYSETQDPKLLLDELRLLGVKTECEEFDLSQPTSPHELFQRATRKLGSPRILINNACFDRAVTFTGLTSELLDKHYAVNLRSATLLCVEFVKTWNCTSGGRIINMTSGQSLGPMNVGQLSYTVTKAGLEMLAKQLAPYLEDKGITINAVDPGPTDTGWMSKELKGKIRRESVVNEPDVVADAVVIAIIATMNWQISAMAIGVKVTHSSSVPNESSWARRITYHSRCLSAYRTGGS